MVGYSDYDEKDVTDLRKDDEDNDDVMQQVKLTADLLDSVKTINTY
ncbi:5022_t:CDS:2 [Diversispora eburnea]|uniref:5022_t:CDS:1 n=1 Tax=Diversispora eburnea TaxID=1213867 RepID=A0A9N8VET0_9GLOM|nr:5022_t:CDS:2 [Diversispora eburnea]